MPNKSLPMNKLRTIIRLYTERVGLRAIAELSRTFRNTVKKYVNKWNALSMTYEAFLAKSDAELYSLFCIDKVSGRGTWERNPFVWRIEFELVK